LEEANELELGCPLRETCQRRPRREHILLRPHLRHIRGKIALRAAEKQERGEQEMRRRRGRKRIQEKTLAMHRGIEGTELDKSSQSGEIQRLDPTGVHCLSDGIDRHKERQRERTW